jgi:hypothetical protein
MKRLSLPVKIGLGFGLAGLLLTIIGIFRGQVPLQPANIAVALVLGGGVWFVVAWAVAAAAVDVEKDGEQAGAQAIAAAPIAGEHKSNPKAAP